MLDCSLLSDLGVALSILSLLSEILRWIVSHLAVDIFWRVLIIDPVNKILARLLFSLVLMLHVVLIRILLVSIA